MRRACLVVAASSLLVLPGAGAQSERGRPSSVGLAGPAEVTVWTARAIATVLAEIGSAFERETGYRLVVSSGS